MDTFFITENLLVVCFAVMMLIVYGKRRKEFDLLQKEFLRLKSKYRQVYGFHEWFGSYDLESFDEGRTWYAMTTTSDGKRLIQGAAEIVYPGILVEDGIFECCQSVRLKLNDMPTVLKGACDQRLSSFVHRCGLSPSRTSRQARRAVLKELMQSQSHCRAMPILKLSESKLRSRGFSWY